jgi:hypothetical protein
MPIQTVESAVQLPILGKIRLGVRKEAKSGALYPSTVEYFVLTDAPEVAKIYGEDPKELDIIFPSDDLDMVLPTWLKWYSAGSKDKTGAIIGGKLNCIGNGPDENGNPGEAKFFAGRDHLTKVIPTRPCKGEGCPDWKNHKGDSQCKQMMRVICILPRVTLYGAYEIDTSSWKSIRSFHSQLRLVQALNKGSFKFIPFKIVREETSTNYIDKDGAQKSSSQFIMFLKPNEDFMLKHGKEVAARLEAFKAAPQILLPASNELIEAPMEDHYPALEVGSMEVETTSQEQVFKAEELLNDPDIVQAFDRLEKMNNTQFSPKNRLIAIRKKEKEADPKAAVLAEIDKAIQNSKPKESTPPVTSGGIM